VGGERIEWFRSCQVQRQPLGPQSSVVPITNPYSLSPKRLQPPGRLLPTILQRRQTTPHITINSQISHVQVDAASAIRTMHACMCICVRMALYFTRDTNSTRKDSYRIPFRTYCLFLRFSSPDILSLLFLRLCFLNSPCRSSTSNLEGLTVAQKTGMMPLRRRAL
jgi:hypothetical protein